MNETPSLSLSGDRFTAVYHLTGSREDAQGWARDICVEQTVEYPEDLIPRQDIREQVLGHIESFRQIEASCYEAVIGFPVETAGRELPQLLNVLFGNISLKPAYRLVRIDLPESLSKQYRGPRFGQRGLRELLNVHDRPLLSTAIKPMGLSPAELAELAYQFALGGIDLIKDDHGLADQSFAQYDQRVAALSDAVRRANEETGARCLYLPNVTAPFDELRERARFAREKGAGGLLISPGLVGLDAMRCIADDEQVRLPILSHPAFQGCFTMSPVQGISHGTLYGQLNRLAGADAAIFPNYGGRFSFSKEECREIIAGSTCAMGEIQPIFPAPAGGMKLDRVGELCEFYGREVVLLIGGDLHRHGPDLVANCRQFAELAARACLD